MTFDDDNRISTFKGPTMGSAASVQYDSDGNLTSGPGTNDTFLTYTFSARNQLLSAGGLSYVLRTFLTSYFWPKCGRRHLGGEAEVGSYLVAK